MTTRSGNVNCNSMINKLANTTFQKALLFLIIVIESLLGTRKAPKFSLVFSFFWGGGGVILVQAIFGGVCFKPERFFWVLIYVPILTFLSLESPFPFTAQPLKYVLFRAAVPHDTHFSW